MTGCQSKNDPFFQLSKLPKRSNRLSIIDRLSIKMIDSLSIKNFFYNCPNQKRFNRLSFIDRLSIKNDWQVVNQKLLHFFFTIVPTKNGSIGCRLLTGQSKMIDRLSIILIDRLSFKIVKLFSIVQIPKRFNRLSFIDRLSIKNDWQVVNQNDWQVVIQNC